MTISLLAFGTMQMRERVTELIETLQLEPHPEGGFYREIFRSAVEVKPDGARPARAALTTIYFLLPEGASSRWHQVDSDEVWHLYEGGPLELFELSPDGSDLKREMLSPIGETIGSPVRVIPAGSWQAARATSSYALVGCTVAPGFEFADFRLLADNLELSSLIRSAWPDVASLV
jgi:uncharacterized protein